MIKVCLIGNGNLAHAIAACRHSEQYNISIYSANASSAEEHIFIRNTAQPDSKAQPVTLTNNLAAATRDASIVLLCVPTHVRKPLLEQLNPLLKDGTAVGALPGTSGFDVEVTELIQASVNTFSAQRVPYICRVVEKSRTVEAFPKAEIHIAANDFPSIAPHLTALLGMPCVEMGHFDEVNLSNSNPLLHTARLYTYILRNGEPDLTIDPQLGFYADWNNAASQTLLAMDEEFMALVKTLNLKGIKSLKEHYGVTDIQTMTQKIRSIESFKKIKFPVAETDKGHRLDLTSRYFAEDFGHGLRYLNSLLTKHKVNNGLTDSIFQLYTSLLNIEAQPPA